MREWACSSMGMNRLCNYVDMDKFRRVNREGSRESEGVEAGVSEKRPTEERGGSTGGKKEWDGSEYGLHQRVVPTRGHVGNGVVGRDRRRRVTVAGRRQMGDVPGDGHSMYPGRCM